MKPGWLANPATVPLEFPFGISPVLNRLVKRTLDIALAAVLIGVTFPLWVILALWVKLDSPGPALYRQKRIGKGGHPFNMLKFRSMSSCAEEELERILTSDEHQKTVWQQFQKLPHDPRLTRCGKILRRFSLDELPQLWNVLCGEMSLVGPRPILPEQQGVYGPDLHLYLQVRPGMTGLWQVNGRNRVPFARRVEWDVCYVHNQSIWMDAYILARTLTVVLRGDGA